MFDMERQTGTSTGTKSHSRVEKLVLAITETGILIGGPGWVRTSDQTIMSRLL